MKIGIRRLARIASSLPEKIGGFPGHWRTFREQPLLLQIRLAFERTLEIIAVIWVLTNFSSQPVIPVYQWY